jgi:hypothetical protein
MNKEHQHKFVIPIEWKYKDAWRNSVGGAYPQIKRVTKLMCECGEVKEL